MGKVEKVIPNLGWMLSFVRTPPGFGMFVVLPFLIILFNELKHFKENVKIKKKRQQILFPNACAEKLSQKNPVVLLALNI